MIATWTSLKRGTAITAKLKIKMPKTTSIRFKETQGDFKKTKQQRSGS